MFRVILKTCNELRDRFVFVADLIDSGEKWESAREKIQVTNGRKMIKKRPKENLS